MAAGRGRISPMLGIGGIPLFPYCKLGIRQTVDDKTRRNNGTRDNCVDGDGITLNKLNCIQKCERI